MRAPRPSPRTPHLQSNPHTDSANVHPSYKTLTSLAFDSGSTSVSPDALHFCSPPPHLPLRPGERELLCPLPSSLHFVQIGPSWRPGEEHLGAFPGAIHLPPDTTVSIQEACWWGWSSCGCEPFQGALFSPRVSRPYRCLTKTNMQEECL